MSLLNQIIAFLQTLFAPSMTPSLTPQTVPSNPPPHPIDLLDLFCQGIAQYEGYNTPGTIPNKCDNPGDLRWPYSRPYPYGATGVAYGTFLVFPDRQTGFNALKTYITRVGQGLSKIYPTKCSIAQFFAIYAPTSDKNNPQAYANWIANYCKVPITTTIAEVVDNYLDPRETGVS